MGGVSAYGASFPGLTSYTGGTGGARVLAATGSDAALAASGSTSDLQAGKTSPQVQVAIDALKKRDTEVRTHEQAHQTAAGRYAGPATFQYQKGPDGVNYAVGGEVSIDTSTIRGDPTATIAKMQQVMRAALAPAQPSAQDLHVAGDAAAAIAQASADQLKAAAGPTDTAAAGQSGGSQTGNSPNGRTAPGANGSAAVTAQEIGATAAAAASGGLGA